MGYYDAQTGDADRTAFRRAEKRYKLYKHSSTSARSSKHRDTVPRTDLSEVLDFRKILELGVKSENIIRLDGDFDWPVFTLQDHPGFYFIPEALSLDEQLHWIKEALISFPEPPNRTNLTAFYGPIYNLWNKAQNGEEVGGCDNPVKLVTDENSRMTSISEASLKSTKEGHVSVAGEHAVYKTYEFRNSNYDPKQQDFKEKKIFMDDLALKSQIPMKCLLQKLRWATLGWQFDWSKRAYDLSLPYRDIPKELAALASVLAKPAMNGDHFNAEAAIVNYFKSDDMLGGHLDDMEADWSKPIVSISFGCKAIFLLGGNTRDENPVAMFLRSGDVVLMAGPARSCYHGVPRIFVDPDESDVPDFDTMDPTSLPFINHIRTSRINLNIRQVF